MAELKMDVDQVEAFANQLRNQYTQELQSLKNNLQSGAQNLNWVGNDADQFKNQRTQEVTAQIQTVINKLEELATTAANNAQRQREVASTL